MVGDYLAILAAHDVRDSVIVSQRSSLSQISALSP
jgi:hypothetical protein